MASERVLLEEVANAGLAAWDAKPFLEKVTDVVPSIIYVYNQDTQSNEYSNRSLGASLGFSAAEILEMGADMMPRLCHPDDLTKVFTHFGRIADLADGEVIQVEYRLKAKNGAWVWLLSHDTVFDRSPDGSVLRHIGVANNITPQKLAEETALLASRAAELANDELRAFAYSVSHDMKSPSNTLKLLLSELQDDHGDGLESDAQDLLHQAQETVDRMQTLIEDVLNHTRLTGQTVEMTPVSLDDVLKDSVQDLRAATRAKGATIEVGPLPWVSGSEVQLRNLFQNLLSNAIKFHVDGAPHVRVYDSSRPGEKHHEVSVEDNGIGIPPGREEHIFGMFKRLHLDSEYPGTGLGLSTCQRIAANHGGTIIALSNGLKGSVFKVTFAKASGTDA